MPIGRNGFRAAGLAAIAVLCALALAGAAPVEAKTVWLCKPKLADNPCDAGFDTTIVTPAGDPVGSHSNRSGKRLIDCFYVYPTVSDDEGQNSDLSIDPEERSIALYQAAYYSQYCRVFAPVYRQVTLSAILGSGEIPPEAAQLAYSDVLAAWKEYLKKHNDGRGVVFIGHSQGTVVLRRLIADQVDPKKKVRKRLVSALLYGGNVLTAKGERTGGDFQRIPTCAKGTETGCVIAFSAFDSAVPAGALFGRPSGGFLGGDPATDEVVCTDPARLSGDNGALRLTIPSEPFAPGTTIGVATQAVGVPQPAVDTPWIEFPDAYAGACSNADDANVLQVTDLPGAAHLNQVPDANWGLHLVDANIALGNLVDVVGRQAARYAKG